MLRLAPLEEKRVVNKALYELYNNFRNKINNINLIEVLILI